MLSLPRTVRIPKHQSKKRITDPFQVFCAQKREEITARHPGDPVGSITSILASIWRGLRPEQKVYYAELARRFDSDYGEICSGTDPVRTESSSEMKITIPMIFIVPRNGCSAAPHQASLTFMDLLVQAKSSIMIHDS
jgi:hypothetical protein